MKFKDALLGLLHPVDSNCVLLMPQARTWDQLRKRSSMVAELCCKTGYRFCDRLHIFSGSRSEVDEVAETVVSRILWRENHKEWQLTNRRLVGILGCSAGLRSAEEHLCYLAGGGIGRRATWRW